MAKSKKQAHTRIIESDFDTADDYAENPAAANPSQNSRGLALASNREPSADLEVFSSDSQNDVK
jgi:hypothetical protein